ncbi:MAG: phosphoribosyl-AMP cyclohydrolase [Candidatus Diapherotrites archaeon]|nr:phosphoribosyl-AMP cyclohydrolase [Candidatus Diapherotrites archaeon]
MDNCSSKLDFAKSGGLIPTIVQDAETKKVLMLAFMNEEALNKTIQTKKAHFYSRSRNKIWLKGEESGNFQNVKKVLVDCDLDSILLLVDSKPACHTGHYSCFFRQLNNDSGIKEIEKPVFNPEKTYKKKELKK